jgi:hypothetical protein
LAPTSPRGELTRFSWLALIRGIPGLGQRLRKVPQDYWDVVDEHNVRVRCPCGHVITIGRAEGRRCECDRVYVWARYVYAGRADFRDAEDS